MEQRGGVLLLLLLAALPSTAQEVWIRPTHSCTAGVASDNSCAVASAPFEDSYGPCNPPVQNRCQIPDPPCAVPDGLDDDNLRNDFLFQLTEDDGALPPLPKHWSELRSMVDGFGFFNVLFDPCRDVKENPNPGNPPTDPYLAYAVAPFLDTTPVDEVGALAGMISDQGLPVVLEVGGPRVPGFLPATDCDKIVDKTIEREIDEILRWADTVSWRVYVLLMDHPILFLIDAYNASRCTSELDSMDKMFDLVGDYMEEMKTRLDAIGQHGVKFGIFGGLSGFDLTTPSGLHYPARSGKIASYVASTSATSDDGYTDFDAFAQALYDRACIGPGTGSLCAQKLDYYMQDQAPQVPLNETRTADPWDFGRIVAAEARLEAIGFESGFNFAPGRCFLNGTSGGHNECTAFASGNRGAYEIVRQFAEEYRADGGDPDVLGLFGWHFYPTDTGPETGEHTWLAMARDTVAFDEKIRARTIVPTYLSDDFETLDQERWDFEVSAHDSTSVGDEWEISSGRLFRKKVDAAAAELRGEIVEDFAAEVRLEPVSSAFQHWLGINFRKPAPGNRIWNVGYGVVLRGNGNLQLLVDGTMADQTGPGTYPPAGGVDIRVEALGSQIWVYANSRRVLETVDSTYSSGYLSLDNSGTDGYFDDFSLSRYPKATPAFSDDFSDGTLLDDWELATGDRGIWSLSGGAAYQADATGEAYLHRADSSTHDSFRMKAKVRLDGCSGPDAWAGLYFRRNDPNALLPADGFTARLYEDDLKLYFADRVFDATGGDLGLDESEYIELDVIALDDRFVVRIDGSEVLSLKFPADLQSTASLPAVYATGELGLAMHDCAAWFDDIVVEDLGE